MREFEWNDVRFFLAVARTGTLTAAAQRLRTDHTTVGRRIKLLEQALRAMLFERHTTGYTLTPQGKLFLGEAEAMESAAISARAAIESADLSLTGTVRIGATDGFGTFFLAPRLGTLRASYPELEVHLFAMPHVFSLSKREADLAIALRQPSEGRLYASRLTDYELGVYGSAAYLDQRAPVTAMDELPGHPFISYIDDRIYAKELDYVPRLHKAIRPKLKISNPIAQLQATLSGYGLCVLPCFIADTVPGLVRVLPDQALLTNSFWLITHADQHNLARVRIVAEFIRAEIAAHRGSFLPPRARAAAPGP